MKYIRNDPLTRAGVVLVGLYAVVAVLSAFHILPWDPALQVSDSYEAPGFHAWLGTDVLGRDVLAKVLEGAKIAFSVGLLASAIALPLGASLGLMAGYFGGWVDEVVVWLFSSLASIPQILLLTSISFVLGRGLPAIYIAVGLTSWAGICRIVRAETMKLKSADYVVSARALGAGHLRVVIFHLIPNIAHLLIVDLTLRFVYAIKSEAILSYLGLGIQGGASWGLMIADARQELMRGIWWGLAGASCAMFGLVLAFQLLGDSLQDSLDPLD